MTKTEIALVEQGRKVRFAQIEHTRFKQALPALGRKLEDAERKVRAGDPEEAKKRGVECITVARWIIDGCERVIAQLEES